MTLDVKSLFTNIAHKEGIKYTREALTERQDKNVPTEFIIRILDFILKNNIFNFDNQFFSQQIGATMGSKPAPSYANIFMAQRIDNKRGPITNQIHEEVLRQYFPNISRIDKETAYDEVVACGSISFQSKTV